MAKKKDKKKSSKKESKPTDYHNTPEYKILDDQSKKLFDLNHAVQTGESKFTKSQLKSALKVAKKDSSGYMKQVLREFETSVSAQVAQETGDYQSHLDTVNENIKEINDDLAANKEFYSLEEQRTLATQAKDYEQTRGNLVNTISRSGMASSTMGSQAVSAADVSQKGLVEGTTAKYDKQIADLERSAAQGNTQAQQQIKALQASHQVNIQQLGLKAETYLGTDKLKGLNLEGYKPLGDISGTFKEDTVKDIQARQTALLDTSKRTSLGF
jgi:hypothetical protein